MISHKYDITRPNWCYYSISFDDELCTRKNIVKTLYKRRTIHFPRILFVKMHQEINFASSGEEKPINSAENKPNY